MRNTVSGDLKKRKKNRAVVQRPQAWAASGGSEAQHVQGPKGPHCMVWRPQRVHRKTRSQAAWSQRSRAGVEIETMGSVVLSKTTVRQRKEQQTPEVAEIGRGEKTHFLNFPPAWRTGHWRQTRRETGRERVGEAASQPRINKDRKKVHRRRRVSGSLRLLVSSVAAIYPEETASPHDKLKPPSSLKEDPRKQLQSHTQTHPPLTTTPTTNG